MTLGCAPRAVPCQAKPSQSRRARVPEDTAEAGKRTCARRHPACCRRPSDGQIAHGTSCISPFPFLNNTYRVVVKYPFRNSADAIAARSPGIFFRLVLQNGQDIKRSLAVTMLPRLAGPFSTSGSLVIFAPTWAERMAGQYRSQSSEALAQIGEHCRFRRNGRQTDLRLQPTDRRVKRIGPPLGHVWLYRQGHGWIETTMTIAGLECAGALHAPRVPPARPVQADIELSGDCRASRRGARYAPWPLDAICNGAGENPYNVEQDAYRCLPPGGNPRRRGSRQPDRGI